ELSWDVDSKRTLEDPRRRHDEREVPPAIERRHVRLMEREAGGYFGGQRVSPLFCKTQYRRREVDAHDLVTVRHEGRGHPTGAAPYVKDRSAVLPGQPAATV